MSDPITGIPSQFTNAVASQYRLEREIGVGGMATVYLAEDLKHHRKVALKMLHAELSAVLGPERFLKEIELTASLQHPHILPLFDSGSADGLLYYVMPYVEGESLRARLDRETQLPVPEAVRIATEVASALDYAHRRGVIHRDVKPENILLHDGSALVADFGIALAVEQARGRRMTQTGISLGTPQYMSPEQAMGERAITARSDISSLGVVTYEMLTGAPPFVGPNAQAITSQVLTEDPVPPAQRRRNVPANVDAAVRTALEKLPADRFGTGSEFAAALASPTTSMLPSAASVARRTDRRLLVVAAMAVVAIVAAVWGWTRAAAVSHLARAAATSRRPWLASLAFPDSADPIGPFAISPDGSRLVYVARGRQGTQLWVRDADALDPRPLAGTDSARYPAVSPNGSRIAFIVGHSLRLVSPGGGPVTTVTDSLLTLSPIEWADNDHVLLTSRRGITTVPVRGGAWQRLTTIDTVAREVFHTSSSALPGSRAILFTVIPRNYGDNARFQIAVSDPTTGAHTALTPGFWARYVEPGYLLVVRPDSALVAMPFDVRTRRVTGAAVTLASSVTVNEGGFPLIAVARTGQLVFEAGSATAARVSLARVSLSGQSALVDSTWAGEIEEIAASPDGLRAAITMNFGTWDIQVRDLRTGGASRITIPGATAGYPAFTTDGARLYFAANNSSQGTIYEAIVGNVASPRAIVRDTVMNLGEPVPSPNGRVLYYVKFRGGRSDIYAHALDRPSVADWPVITTQARQRSPTPSPDGRWLAYVSDESGRAEVYVRYADTARTERWTISTDGGRAPRWSRDGHELFYITGDSLISAEVSTAPDFFVRSRRALFSLAPFSNRRGQYDVLPGTQGFLMLAKRDTGSTRPRAVFVDQWQSLLTSAVSGR